MDWTGIDFCTKIVWFWGDERYFFLDKEGRITKWIDINGKRGGEEGIENLNLQSIQVALILLSSCSEVALFQGWK